MDVEKPQRVPPFSFRHCETLAPTWAGPGLSLYYLSNDSKNSLHRPYFSQFFLHENSKYYANFEKPKMYLNRGSVAGHCACECPYLGRQPHLPITYVIILMIVEMYIFRSMKYLST